MSALVSQKIELNLYERLITVLPQPEFLAVKDAVISKLKITRPAWENTIKGRTHYPNLYILIALAEVMDCTLDQVCDPEFEFSSNRERVDRLLAEKFKLNVA